MKSTYENDEKLIETTVLQIKTIYDRSPKNAKANWSDFFKGLAAGYEFGQRHEQPQNRVGV